jgi:hypothetical protein
MQYDSVIGETAEKPLNHGSAGALEEVAGEIRKIEAEIADPEEALNTVRELAARLESEVAEADRRSREIESIAIVLKMATLPDLLRNTGRELGLKQAATAIRLYLNDQPEDLT